MQKQRKNIFKRKLIIARMPLNIPNKIFIKNYLKLIMRKWISNLKIVQITTMINNL